jgi:DNA-binding transcriptional MerR regulator
MASTDERRTYSIRQLCREFDVTPRALRFYEDKGLIAPGRRGQTRVYTNRDRIRLRLIVHGKHLGFSLADIHHILDLYDRKDGGTTQMAGSLVKYRAQIETLKRRREALDAALEELTVGCAWLEQRLKDVRPDLLPHSEDYHSLLSARLDHDLDDEWPPIPSRTARPRS